MIPESSPEVTLRRPNRALMTESAIYQEVGRLLVERNSITRSQFDDANVRSTLLGKGLDEVLLEENWVPEAMILELLSEVTGIPTIPMARFSIPREGIRKVSAGTALTYRIIPVAFNDESITIATHRIHEVTGHDSLQTLLRMPVSWVLCTRSEVDAAIKHFYGLGADLLKAMDGAVARPQASEGELELSTPGLSKLLGEIIREAIQRNASDIHLEPMEDRMSLRYRVDGSLIKIPLPEGVERHYKSIVSALKVLAQLNITERRLPHDGRARMTVDGETFDLRVSILPTQYGEAANLRILNRKTTFLTLQELGLRASQLPLIRELMSRPHGIVLITGPTGSGKTSTLYAALSSIRTDSISVVTIEDPVEYQLDGILQIQAQSEIGLTFAAGLRAVLRHDPNVILIGEIRDTETADIAIKSSLTGHLVFSTLHTNDSAGAMARLTDMGIEPYLVASSVQGVIAQRLVRRVCQHCGEPMELPAEILREVETLFPEQGGKFHFIRGRGCPDCKFTGYKGRLAIFEILMMDQALRPLVVRNVPSDEIRRLAVARGMETLRHNAWQVAMEGITTIEEVLRVTPGERT
jgi:type II secretory ATPase GspE/PulE/Tfp pilus assembly ATPase PilB-like protein